MKLTTVLIGDFQLTMLNEFVRLGLHPSRSDAIRQGIQLLILQDSQSPMYEAAKKLNEEKHKRPIPP